MCETSSQINELAGALAKAQGEIEGASKDATNPHFGKKYADLSSVWDACRAPLTKNGLSVVQGVAGTERGVKVTTILMHASGQWIRSELDVPAMKLDAQGIGSATTYGRRYALAAMVGVAPEDDDGNAATGKGDERQRRDKPANGDKKPDTKRRMADDTASMTEEEEAIYRGKINTFGALIDAAVSAGDRQEMEKIAAMLKSEEERIKGVMRPKFSAGLKVLNAQHLPESERPKQTEDSPI